MRMLAAPAAVLAALAAAGAAAAPRTIVAAQDGAPVWSPDGSRIAFTRTTTAGTTLLVLHPARPRIRATGIAGRYQLKPSWSPDGSRIAFQAREGIFVTSARGGGLDELVPGSGLDFAPVWSPDGNRIAFLGTRGDAGRGMSLWTVRPDGTGLARLATAVIGEPRWSPDSSFLLFQREEGLFTIARDGTGERELAAAPLARHPSLSPLADRVAFVHDRRVQVVSLATRAVTTLGARHLWVGPPAWTSDGRSLVFVHEGGVGLVGAERGPELLRVPGRFPLGAAVSVSPDGNTIAFPAPRQECREHYGIALLPLASRTPTVLTNTCLIRGGDGDDRIAGTPGRDRIDGRGGNDTILAGDRARDEIRCGAGRDRVSADRRDDVARDCERVRRGA